MTPKKWVNSRPLGRAWRNVPSGTVCGINAMTGVLPATNGERSLFTVINIEPRVGGVRLVAGPFLREELEGLVGLLTF